EVGIAEIDVSPSHGRRGIGAALLEHACAWAAESGYPSVVLGTLSDVPWNAPFYARTGWTRWPAPAKLNLFLRITGRRDDGYHELQTVFRLLDWGDELRLRMRV